MMRKIMEWSDPVIVLLAEKRGASGAGVCDTGSSRAAANCGPVGWGAYSSCGDGAVPGPSGTLCNPGTGGDTFS